MKVSASWLRDFVPIRDALPALAQQLTAAGIEVEGCASAAPAFSSVAVGEVLRVRPHPEAEKLQVCEVTLGGAKVLQIVCGASNVRAGLKVAVAQVGANLPRGVVIGRAELRGVESEGMLCSARELGLYEDSDGILELEGGLNVGTDLREALDLDDGILDIKPPANRGDCMSVLGIAREISAITERRYLSWQPSQIETRSREVFSVRIDAPEACPIFASRIIRNLRAHSKSPAWLVERLRRVGLNSISPAVDVTNYVMLELGQPLHAYDLDRLNSQLIVRFAVRGEHLLLLNDQEVELQPDCLVIASPEGPIGLAGIFGGKHTAISPGTRHVLLESAHFAPAAVAGRARRFGLFTDAAQRFERGVDPSIVGHAIERATQLLTDICAGDAGPVSIVGALPTDQRFLELRAARAARLLGIDVPAQETATALASISPSVRSTANGWRVLVPSHRFDLRIEADLIEEVIRLYGMDRVTAAPALAAQSTGTASEKRVPVDRLMAHLAARGYREIINYSFEAAAESARLFPGERTLVLENPLSSALSAMRISLWPGLLRTCALNIRHQQRRVRLFEIGRTYHGAGAATREVERLALLMCGSRAPEQWGAAVVAADFYDLKGDTESMLELAGSNRHLEFISGSLPCLHPGRCAKVVIDGAATGWIGQLHPRIASELQLPDVHILELDLDHVLRSKMLNYQDISQFPSVRRDFSISVDEAVTYAQIEACIHASSVQAVKDIVLFDVFRGAAVDSGRKSIAFGLILQDPSRTLVDSEIEAMVAQVRDRLKRDLHAAFRE